MNLLSVLRKGKNMMNPSKKLFAVSADFSGPGKMTVPALKEFILNLSKFGYNAFLLSMADTYEVKEEPYFGYLKGKYTKSEIQELDSYCVSLGVELIPDIQVLAHVGTMFKWPHYWDYCDTGDILLVGDKKVKILLDHMFSSLREMFSSHRIHIGCDEAYCLGKGKYQDLHGEKEPLSILKEHLSYVKELCQKYDFEPMMWSDMLFRSIHHNNYWNTSFHFSEAQKKEMPKGIPVVYWDYDGKTKEHYQTLIRQHKEAFEDVYFATTVNTYEGLAPLNTYTLERAFPAMDACKEEGIDNIIVTLWCDDGYECSYNTALPCLFAIKRYYDGIEDMVQIQKEFSELTGENFAHLFALEKNNLVKHPAINNNNEDKWMFYSDPFLGYLDQCVKEGTSEDFHKLSKELASYEKESKYDYLFAEGAALSDFLSVKAELGVKTRNAYQKHNKEELKDLISEYSLAIEKLDAFYKAFETMWKKENKDMGLEKHQFRIGALKFRLQKCKDKLLSYLNGEIDHIPELEQEMLDYFGNGKTMTDDSPTLVPFRNIIEVY